MKAPQRIVEVLAPESLYMKTIINPAFDHPDLEQALIQYVALNYGTLAGRHWQEAWRVR